MSLKFDSTRTLAVLAAAFLAIAGASVLLWFGGCAANDPFDPESLDNLPPTISFFVSPLDTSQELSPTSYSERIFRWSGTDPDGWVAEYFVAIDTSGFGEVVWDTTTSTDTTMTFSPDVTGNADATFMVACRDNRGAFSDTIVQFIPMHNFPPVVEFEPDFDPLNNLQREFRDADGNVIEDGSAAADTVFWNWGPGNFRFHTYDLDGASTLEDFFRYTLADVLPDSTFDEGDPRANPETAWVRVPFSSDSELRKFEILVKSAEPGAARTLSVSVKDTEGSGPIFQYSWEVRAPKGPVIYISDASASRTKDFYTDYLNQRFGEGNWDTYLFWNGFPDRDFTLMESLRKFEMILWTDTGTASNNIRAASVAGGILEQYVAPAIGDHSEPKKILLVSRILTGTNSGLSNPFRQGVLGIDVRGAPEATLAMPVGPQALGLQPHLPAISSTRGTNSGGIGLQLYNDSDSPFHSEFLYQMEECGLCYGDGRRPAIPPDPFVAVKVVRSIDLQTAVVGISLQLDDFDPTEAFAALDAILEFDLGMVAP